MNEDTGGSSTRSPYCNSILKERLPAQERFTVKSTNLAFRARRSPHGPVVSPESTFSCSIAAGSGALGENYIPWEVGIG